MSFDWSEAGESIIDTVDAAGLMKKPNELTWLLIFRSLTTAFAELMRNYANLFRTLPNETELAQISACFEQEIDKCEVSISLDFFCLAR